MQTLKADGNVVLVLSRREAVLLRAALNDVNAGDADTELEVRRNGETTPVDDDEFTDLYGQLGEVLR